MTHSKRLACLGSITLGFLAVGFVVYSGVVSSFFVSDDFVMLQRLQTTPFAVWSNVGGYSFFPMMYLVLLAEGQVWGLSATGYHVVSIALHVANALLVCLLTMQTAQAFGGKSASWRVVSIFAGLWFLVSPSHTEAVSWIAARHHVLATFFGLLALAAYAGYRAGGRRALLAASLPLFAAALLSKEAVLVLPLVVLLYDALTGRAARDGVGQQTRPLTGFLLFAAVALAYLTLRQWYFGGLTAGLTASGAEPASIAAMVGNLLRQFSRAVLPPLPGRGASIIVACVLAGALALSLARAAVKRQMHDQPGVVAALLFLLPAYLLATLAYLPFHVSTIDSQGERFLYWPSAFLTIAVVVALYGILGNGRRLYLLLAAVVLLSAAALYQQNQNWRVAAGISESVVADACALAEMNDTLIVLNLPDNVKGAYVLRNGIWHAVQLFCPPPRASLSVVILSTHGVASAADVANIQRRDGGYSVQAPQPFVQQPVVAKGMAGYLDTSSATGDGFRLNVGRLPERTRIVYYTAGRLWPAP